MRPPGRGGAVRVFHLLRGRRAGPAPASWRGRAQLGFSCRVPSSVFGAKASARPSAVGVLASLPAAEPCPFPSFLRRNRAAGVGRCLRASRPTRRGLGWASGLALGQLFLCPRSLGRPGTGQRWCPPGRGFGLRALCSLNSCQWQDTPGSSRCALGNPDGNDFQVACKGHGPAPAPPTCSPLPAW